MVQPLLLRLSDQGVPLRRQAFKPFVGTMSCGWRRIARECSRALLKRKSSWVQSRRDEVTRAIAGDGSSKDAQHNGGCCNAQSPCFPCQKKTRLRIL
jgi:hypothetical protein